MALIRLRTGALAVGLTLAAALTAPTATATTAAAPTVEEQRLDRAVPREILARSGFDALAERFARRLADAPSPARARRVVGEEGTALWRRAVDRAQGRGPAGGDLSRDDDRPLYWARLAMTRHLRTWQPHFALSDARRAALLDRLERTSRGQTDVRLGGGGKGVRRVLVTGTSAPPTPPVRRPWRWTAR
jgi:hypothetical protein